VLKGVVGVIAIQRLVLIVRYQKRGGGLYR